jgi:hypothetical protein
VSDHPLCGYAAEPTPYKGGDYAGPKIFAKNKKALLDFVWVKIDKK